MSPFFFPVITPAAVTEAVVGSSLTNVNFELSKVVLAYGALLTPITFAVAVVIPPLYPKVNTFGDATIFSTAISPSASPKIRFTCA